MKARAFPRCGWTTLLISAGGTSDARSTFMLSPGSARGEIRPQRADLAQLELTTHTIRGPIEFSSRGKLGSRELTLNLPARCEGELVVSGRGSLKPERISGPGELARYRAPSANRTAVHLQFT